MPKGQTSRPYNRAERKAAASSASRSRSVKGLSSANRNKVYSSRSAGKDHIVLQNRKRKAEARRTGNLMERSRGKSITHYQKLTPNKKGGWSSVKAKRK